MMKITKKILLLLTSLLLAFSFVSVNGANEDDDIGYTTYRSIDLGTFNEYRYKMTKGFFDLRDSYEIYSEMDIDVLNSLDSVSREGLKYLPESLHNQNLQKQLSTAIQKAKRNTGNEAYYVEVVNKLSDYVDGVSIKSLKGSVEAIPKEGNAPLNVTFRANVTDPETLIPQNNHVWWISENGNKKVIGSGLSINYTFLEEGNYTVFLDVKSAHKNAGGYNSVLPFRGKVNIKVKEKIASLIVKVNGDSLRFTDELKFTPEAGRYGLLFDATSSIPTGGAKFTKTTWDFGNGIEREYNGEPKVERVIYNKEGDYEVELKLKTNLGNTVTKKFYVSIHDPIATIKVSPNEGFLGDKFTFSTKTIGNDDNLTYDWKIVDIKNDKEIKRIQSKLFTYSFTQKGHFNVILKVGAIGTDEADIDTKVIYINSRAPVAQFNYSIPNSSKPNRILLDATDSYDLDHTDDGKLKYYWEIDGNKVNLEDANSNGSLGYFTFDSIGDHSVSLRIEDPDGIEGILDKKVNVKSILSVDFDATPRAIKRGQTITFKATSPEAKIYEWDFADGDSEGGTRSTIRHTFEKSGIYDVKLKVRDLDENINTVNKTVYVADGNNPVAILEVRKGAGESPALSRGVCNGRDAYIVDRANTVTFDASQSIDVDGNRGGLDYSIKIGTKPMASKTVSYKYDELGCFPVKLTVSSKQKRTRHSVQAWVKVENLEPRLSSLSAKVINMESDPVVVDITANGAKDEDGVITSYLWYYTTDVDPEPQDFRATSGPSTKFVLPKITGNYYFVVVLTDDNQTRVSSEELGRTATVALTGDNANVPLVDLKVNDSSLYIGEEVVFNATVKNILGKNITKKSKYYWDFDGDGFYDLETDTSTITHKYEDSGEYRPKLKVKYKGFSNTRTLNINVSNRLKADFDYISIGNKYVFINNSIGSYNKIVWDMGDGEKVEGKDAFTYKYDDNKSGHNVKLLISDGKNTKTKTHTVKRNVKNLIDSKKMDFVVFTSPELVDDEIVLESKQKEIYVYLGANPGDISRYIIDKDISVDSDLNGTEDDDEDLENASGEVFKVSLNESREQTIKLSIKDSDGVLVNTKEIKIVKNYIEFGDVDMESLTFKLVSDSEKEKIEDLKLIIATLPNQEVKLKSMMYLQKLQEEWGDDTEKTKTIIEFEGYLEQSNSSYKDDIINLLESLLVEGEDDKSERNVAYTALVNLLPQNIACTYTEEYSNCKSYLVSKLDAIKISSDVEVNKVLGSEILKVVEVDTIMANNDKLDFRAIMESLVYGSVDNIPTDTKDEVNQNEGEKVEEGESMLTGVLLTLLKILGGVIALFIFLYVVYFIYFKLTNKDKDKSLSDFILDKTKAKDETGSNNSDDILGDFGETETKKEETKDVLDDTKKEAPKTGAKKDEKVPDWLSGKSDFKLDENKSSSKTSNSSPVDLGTTVDTRIKNDERKDFKKEEKKDPLEKINKPQPKKSENKSSQEEKVPDWLKGSFDASKSKDEKIAEPKKEAKVDLPKQETSKPKEVNNSNKKEEKVPDWLAGSFSEDKPKKQEAKKEQVIKQELKKQELKKEEVKIVNETNVNIQLPKQEVKEVKQELPKPKAEPKKSSEENIPDWLKGSLADEPKKDKQDNKQEQAKKQEQSKKQDLPKEPLKTPKIEEPKKNPVKDDLDKVTSVEEEKVPDWLKGSLKDTRKDDSSKAKEANSAAKKEEKIPDWLKGSLADEDKTEAKKEIKKEDKPLDLPKKEIKKPEVKSEAKKEPLKDENKDKSTPKVKPVEKKSEIKTDQKNNQKPKVKAEDKKEVPKETPKKAPVNKQDSKKAEPKKEEVKKEEVNKPEAKKAPVKKQDSKKTEPKKEEVKSEQNLDDTKLDNSNELWDNGMEVPDWLKTDDKK